MSDDSSSRRNVTVNLKDGLHLRPISLIVETVRRYGCQVRIANGDHWADAGNVLDLIPLKAEFGTQLILEASGEKAVETLDELVLLFEHNFDDPQADG